MDNKEILELSTSAWREKVYIETCEHVISAVMFLCLKLVRKQDF